MRAVTVAMSITGDTYHNCVLEVMKTDEQSLPATALTQKHTRTKHTHLAQHGTVWCDMRQQL